MDRAIDEIYFHSVALCVSDASHIAVVELRAENSPSENGAEKLVQLYFLERGIPVFFPRVFSNFDP